MSDSRHAKGGGTRQVESGYLDVEGVAISRCRVHGTGCRTYGSHRDEVDYLDFRRQGEERQSRGQESPSPEMHRLQFRPPLFAPREVIIHSYDFVHMQRTLEEH